jgi:hypothetical protein
MQRRRRLPRILLNAATTVLLVLCVGSVVLWLWSNWYRPTITYRGRVGPTRQLSSWAIAYHSRVTFGFWSCHFGPEGRDQYIRVENDGNAAARWSWEAFRNEPLNEPTRRGMRWFQYVHVGDGSPGDPADPVYDVRRLTVPLPLLTLLTGGLAGMRLIGYVRRRRTSRSGRCPGCGYDLRATPDRCPECGAVPAGTSA